MQEHDILILGAGWMATFLIPLLRARHLSFAATTRDGRKVAGAETIKWSFDPDEEPGTSKEKSGFSKLPLAKCVLITFPLTGNGQSKLIVGGYEKVWHKKGSGVKFMQLGSTGIWQIPNQRLWVSRKSPYNKENARAIAEDELLDLGGCVLNLAGLWGGDRDPRNWVDRVAKTKEEVRGKKSLHLIHGQDVARAILAIVGKWDEGGEGQRWMLTDGFVYDWWSLFAGWADVKQKGKDETEGDKNMDREPSDQAKWAYELMVEERVQALPRSMEILGRCYDAREFWQTFGIVPLKAKV